MACKVVRHVLSHVSQFIETVINPDLAYGIDRLHHWNNTLSAPIELKASQTVYLERFDIRLKLPFEHLFSEEHSQ